MSSQVLVDLLNSTLSNNNVLNYFNQILYNSVVDNEEFSPDINGYTMIFLIPPYLSGYGVSDNDEKLIKTSKMSCFLAIDFTPPSIQVTASEIMARTGNLPYGIEVISSGQMNITYLESNSLRIFSLHKSWITYIEDVTRGLVEPDSQFINDEECILDYATSAYVIRFKPTRSFEWGDIIYVGKAIGIFPLNMPDKEIIGRRDSHEITTLPITYTCTLYRQQVINAPMETSGWIFDEIKEKCFSRY